MAKGNPTVYCSQGPDELLPTSLGILTGLRFVFKDLFDVKGYVTGAGNPAWLATHRRAKGTSPLLETLLAQGAECVGRVQTDELAYSLNGQNMHYGTPENPRAPDCIPGGSSSGSAVTVANGEADFAIGTDTGGSVRVPASYCGIFGLRPTLGKLPLKFAFQLAKSFDTAGLFARQLPVLKQVYQVLTNSGSNLVTGTIATSTAFDSAEYAARMSVLTSSAVQQGIAIGRMRDVPLLHHRDELSELFRTIQGFEIIFKHGEWLAQHELSLDPAIAARVDWARTITRDDYQQARQIQKRFRTQFIAQLRSCGGVLALPTTPAGPPKLVTPAAELAQYRSRLMGLTAIAGLTGCPQLHIPVSAGTDSPSGVSLLGLPDSELILINTASKLVGDGESL